MDFKMAAVENIAERYPKTPKPQTFGKINESALYFIQISKIILELITKKK